MKMRRYLLNLLSFIIFHILQQQNCSARAITTSSENENDSTENMIYPLTTATTLGYANSMNSRKSRAMPEMQDYDQQMDDETDNEEAKAIKSDPWTGYYDFLINEGSFKFWAAFQLATAILLIYSALAAVYYAKFNPISSDYDYEDDFIFRSNGRSNSGYSGLFENLDKGAFQRIIDAIALKKYS